jgi:acyl-CoA thioesterase
VSDAAALASACADAMWANDGASQALGIRIDSIAPGQSRLSMTVVKTMVNGHDLCHGGYIFTLADSAFAFACNTYDTRTVAQHCEVTFLVSGKLGDRLTADARERHRAGRSGIYDVTVSREDGTVIAEFRGLSRTIGGSIVTTGDPA